MVFVGGPPRGEWLVCRATLVRLLFAARRGSCNELVAYNARRIDKSTAFTSLVSVPSEM